MTYSENLNEAKELAIWMFVRPSQIKEQQVQRSGGGPISMCLKEKQRILCGQNGMNEGNSGRK